MRWCRAPSRRRWRSASTIRPPASPRGSSRNSTRWGDTGGDIESVFPFETLATLLSVYWFTETIGSSVRLYKEAFADQEITSPMPRHDVPQGVLVPADSDLPAPRAWGERNLQNLVHWNEAGRAGISRRSRCPMCSPGTSGLFHREIGERRAA